LSFENSFWSLFKVPEVREMNRFGSTLISDYLSQAVVCILLKPAEPFFVRLLHELSVIVDWLPHDPDLSDQWVEWLFEMNLREAAGGLLPDDKQEPQSGGPRWLI
jgi:hypothetical protein